MWEPHCRVKLPAPEAPTNLVCSERRVPMKCFVLAAVALMGAALLGTDQAGACGCGCCAKQAAPANPGKVIDPNVKTREVMFNVSGMFCASCAAKVQKALDVIPWVVKAQVDREKNMATVTVVAEKYDDKVLLKAVEDAGYSAKPMK